MKTTNHTMTTLTDTQKPRVFLWEAAAAAVRVVGTADAPWFVAKDVCAVLEIQNVSQALDSLDEDEKGICNTYTLGGAQEMLTINESGLYALIFRSRKSQAKVFRKWVTSEVLPQIRKTGAYAPAPAEAYRAKLAPHVIEIFHRPAPPDVVPNSEEQIVAHLLFVLLGKLRRGIFHAATIVDIARRDEEFSGWFPIGRPLTGCYSPLARVQITPQGTGHSRRDVITSWFMTPTTAVYVATPGPEALNIVAAAITEGEVVKVV